MQEKETPSQTRSHIGEEKMTPALGKRKRELATIVRQNGKTEQINMGDTKRMSRNEGGERIPSLKN